MRAMKSTSPENIHPPLEAMGVQSHSRLSKQNNPNNEVINIVSQRGALVSQGQTSQFETRRLSMKVSDLKQAKAAAAHDQKTHKNSQSVTGK